MVTTAMGSPETLQVYVHVQTALIQSRVDEEESCKAEKERWKLHHGRGIAFWTNVYCKMVQFHSFVVFIAGSALALPALFMGDKAERRNLCVRTLKQHPQHFYTLQRTTAKFWP